MLKEKINKTGFILIDKPSGITSHDAVDRLRRITGVRKIGHAGTLDPFATGLLIMAIGRDATKQISTFVKMDKEYVAELRFGAETDTYDREGKIVKQYDTAPVTEERVRESLQRFVGPQLQIPPMYSAKKINGQKLYELARQNIEVERAPVPIELFELELLEYAWPSLTIRVHCSSGTYIRSIAFDLGRLLNCGAYLQELRRTKIGEQSIEQAISLAELEDDVWTDYLFNL